MEDKYSVSDFGKATFIAKKGWKFETESLKIAGALIAAEIDRLQYTK